MIVFCLQKTDYLIYSTIIICVRFVCYYEQRGWKFYAEIKMETLQDFSAFRSVLLSNNRRLSTYGELASADFTNLVVKFAIVISLMLNRFSWLSVFVWWTTSKLLLILNPSLYHEAEALCRDDIVINLCRMFRPHGQGILHSSTAFSWGKQIHSIPELTRTVYLFGSK